MCNFYYFNKGYTKYNEIKLFRLTIVLVPVSSLLVYRMIDIFQIYLVRSKSRLHQQIKAFLTLYLLTVVIIYSFLNPNPDRPLAVLIITETRWKTLWLLRDHPKSILWHSHKKVEIKAQHHEISIAHRFNYDFHVIVG